MNERCGKKYVETTKIKFNQFKLRMKFKYQC